MKSLFHRHSKISTVYTDTGKANSGLGIMSRQQLGPALSPAKIEKKKTWLGDEKLALK